MFAVVVCWEIFFTLRVCVCETSADFLQSPFYNRRIERKICTLCRALHVDREMREIDRVDSVLWKERRREWGESGKRGREREREGERERQSFRAAGERGERGERKEREERDDEGI